MREDMREGRILLLPLKLLDFGGERLPRIFNAHTHEHTHTHTHTHGCCCNIINGRRISISNGSRSRSSSCRWSSIKRTAAASPFLPFFCSLWQFMTALSLSPFPHFLASCASYRQFLPSTLFCHYLASHGSSRRLLPSPHLCKFMAPHGSSRQPLFTPQFL